MRVTQGAFSVPARSHRPADLGPGSVLSRQGLGGEISISPTIRIPQHLLEMWGLPMFDLRDAAGVMMELNECRKVYGDRYIRMSAFDASHGWEVDSPFVHRQPPEERAGLPARTAQVEGRSIRYTTTSYAVDRPEGDRYGGKWSAPAVSPARPSAAARKGRPASRVSTRSGSARARSARSRADRSETSRPRIREIASLLLIESIAS